jgi:1,4-dihydroxy-2-naphthoate octaprenyltransferase
LQAFGSAYGYPLLEKKADVTSSRQYVTLDKKSPEFEAYLKGTFSTDKRALPVKSLNVNSSQETVTFEIVPLSEIQKPNFLVVWLKAIRIRSFLIVLFPMFLILAKNASDNSIKDPWTLLCSSLGVIILFAAVNLRNDYVDHVKGFDRIDEKLGSRPIQSGWLTADSVRKVANVFIFIAALLAFPVFIAFPQTLLFILLSAFIGYLTLYRLKFTFKEFAGGEFGILLLVGPLLACGYEMAISGTVRKETLLLGVLWGWLALLPVHLQNLELILTQSQAGVSNLITYLGFDKGKKFIHYWWFIGVVGFVAYHFYFSGFYWFWFLSLVIIFTSLRFANRLLNLQSPVGSQMKSIKAQGSYLLVFVIGLWIFEVLWILLL